MKKRVKSEHLHVTTAIHKDLLSWFYCILQDDIKISSYLKHHILYCGIVAVVSGSNSLLLLSQNQSQNTVIDNELYVICEG